MNALAAMQSATTQKTLSTPTATGADSTQAPRIDKYIEALFAKANSEDFSTLKQSADSALRHGFTNCANSRLAASLEAYRGSPLRDHYQEKYPACVFLPWAALRGVIDALHLWCELPQHYVGAIPPEQLPWLDLFALDSGDLVLPREMIEFVHGVDAVSTIMSLLMMRDIDRPGFRVESASRALDLCHDSFFVLAPKEAFNTQEDFLERFRKLSLSVSTKETTPPDDPLVIRFVHGGALVVAAWGEEASVINAMAREVEGK